MVPDILVAAVGLSAVGVSIWALIKPPVDLHGLDVILSAGLTALGLLMLSTVIERRTKLEALASRLESLAALLTDARYLPYADAVKRALEEAVEQTRQRVLAIGSKSTARRYLRSIEYAVMHRNVTYYRILDGDSIFHPLHEHLVKLHGRKNVFIALVDRENYGNITVCDGVTVLAFPSPFQDKFSGLSVLGAAASTQYGEQILAIYATANRVDDVLRLKALCADCRAK